MKKTAIIAHRGKKEFFPENTLISFAEAVKAGADGIELDVYLSADGVLVVHHDYLLGNTDNGAGLIYEKNIAYIKSLDAGSWFAAKFRGEKIPTLDEVFRNFGKTIEFEIELKGFDRKFVDSFLTLVKKYDLLKRIEITSANLPLVMTAKKSEPKIRSGIFISPRQSWMSQELAQKIALSQITLGDFAVAHCPVSLLTPDWVGRLQASGILVHAADCDESADLNMALALRVDQLSTSKLDRALAEREFFLKKK